MGRRLPRPRALQDSSLPLASTASSPSTSAPQLITVARATPAPGLATSQPRMSGLGAWPQSLSSSECSWLPRPSLLACSERVPHLTWLLGSWAPVETSPLTLGDRLGAQGS